MNRVANMNPERRMKKLLSDRYANMSAERRAKKKEVKFSISISRTATRVRMIRVGRTEELKCPDSHPETVDYCFYFPESMVNYLRSVSAAHPCSYR